MSWRALVFPVKIEPFGSIWNHLGGQRGGHSLSRESRSTSRENTGSIFEKKSVGMLNTLAELLLPLPLLLLDLIEAIVVTRRPENGAKAP